MAGHSTPLSSKSTNANDGHRDQCETSLYLLGSTPMPRCLKNYAGMRNLSFIFVQKCEQSDQVQGEQQRILDELRSLKEITRIQNSAKNARWPHEATRCMAGTINATIGVTQAKFGHSIWGCEMHMVFQILKYKNDCMIYLGAELALMKVCLL